jgi:hypothetical protein
MGQKPDNILTPGLSYGRIISILSDRVYMENLLSQFTAVKQIEALAMAK